MNPKEGVIGPSRQEIEAVNQKVDNLEEIGKVPLRKRISRRVAGGVLAASLLTGGAGCTLEVQPTPVSATQTPESIDELTPTSQPTETPIPTETPFPTETPIPTPQVIRPETPELFGAGGPNPEFEQRVESGEFKDQEELLKSWVDGPWAELGIFHPETESISFKYFQDLETEKIIIGLESEDYLNQIIYYPLDLELSQELGEQVFDTEPTSFDPRDEMAKIPLFLGLSGSPEGINLPDDSVLAVKNGNWIMVNPEGETVGEINLETGSWQIVEQPTPTPEPTETLQPTLQPTMSPTKEPTPVPTEDSLDNEETVEQSSLRLLEIPLDAQDLSLSCESGASAMVAAYFGVPIPEGYASLEDYFIKTIPKHCNPHKGFRGLISGALSTSCNAEAGLGYGVYAEPVAEALQRLGVPAEVHYGVSYDWVAEQVKADRPVVVWMSGRDVQPEYETDPETGEEYVLLLGQHLWVVSGVDGGNGSYRFRINDPWKGRQFWVWGFPNWNVFGNMSIVAGE